MSEKHDIAARLVDAFTDLKTEVALRVCDPEVELTTLFDQPGEPGFHGHDGVQEWFQRMDRLWAFIQIVDWTSEEHGDWVLVTGTARVRGRASPNVLTLDYAGAGKVADGHLTKLGLYVDRAAAMRAIELG